MADSMIIRAPMSESRSDDMWFEICPTRLPPAGLSAPSSLSFLAVGSSRSWIRSECSNRSWVMIDSARHMNRVEM